MGQQDIDVSSVSEFVPEKPWDQFEYFEVHLKVRVLVFAFVVTQASPHAGN